MKRNLLLLTFLSLSLGSLAQQNTAVDFTHLKAELSIYPLEEKVSGELVYTFDVLEKTDSVFIDAVEMEFVRVLLNGEEVDISNDGERLWIYSDFLKSSGNRLQFDYSATPAQAMYFVGRDSLPGNSRKNEVYHAQVWTQGQGKNTSHWLPSFDDTREKVEFDFSIRFHENYEVVTNGKLLQKQRVNDSIIRWDYDMIHPMSSYLAAVAVGKYDKVEITTSGGTPISLYYYPGDEEYVEPTYRHTRKMFDFLEEKIGVEFPWQSYRQIPVRDFLYSGMENTGTTIFSDFFMTDSIGYKDRNYVMVNAHELAHQWFGDMVTAAKNEDHWLQEGFATYYALLAEREVFGNDYYYWQLYESAERLKARSDRGKGEALLSGKGGSLTYYQKGAWALHILSEELGEEAFKTGIHNYLVNNQYKSVTTSDFIEEMEKASGHNLSEYVDLWLRQSAFPGTEALNSLRKSEFIDKYLGFAALKELPLTEKKELLGRGLEFPVNDYIGQEVVHQLALENPLDVLDLYMKAFETNNVIVRQSIALTLTQIPRELKSRYESLLDDESYLTREAALYNLWMNFPDDRSGYLEQVAGVRGFYDRNIEILWLALSLATPDYKKEQQDEIYSRLTGYTSPYYAFYIRQNAFRLIFQLDAFNDDNLRHLLEGTQHAVSRFRTFSREMLGELLQRVGYQVRFQQLLEELPAPQQAYLESRLKQV